MLHRKFVEYYNYERPHMSPSHDTPDYPYGLAKWRKSRSSRQVGPAMGAVWPFLFSVHKKYW